MIHWVIESGLTLLSENIGNGKLTLSLLIGAPIVVKYLELGSLCFNISTNSSNTLSSISKLGLVEL